jgi:hypothetical protein
MMQIRCFESIGGFQQKHPGERGAAAPIVSAKPGQLSLTAVDFVRSSFRRALTSVMPGFLQTCDLTHLKYPAEDER